uniref:Fe2OG dioxygenase domain-containing protein n=1 Tax=Oryza nivara TaxID=4536 RepID=A0A0E0FNJ5_ORYNI
MEIPVIDLKGLAGGDEERERTMAQLHEACKAWGFFWVENHGVEAALMEEVKSFVYRHYDEHLEKKFYASDLAKNLHLNKDDGAELLAGCISTNLGLAGAAGVVDAFAPPFVGTKFAMYPPCPRPDLVWGLRAHTDAGGIILLLQDDAVGGLEFHRGGREWVPVGPTRRGRLFVNIGDQVEVLSGGAYKSVVHRVAAGAEGRRLSVATFYNPGPDAVIAPATAAAPYPGPYRYGDYLDYYQGTKFGDKAARFQAVKKLFS